MPIKRVTLQDIADACGLSRNTVSKVFNDRGAVLEATRNKVLSKAQELGYFQIPELETVSGATEHKKIALLSQPKLLSHNFGSYFLTSFTDSISRAGYTLKFFEISPEEIALRKLPPHLDLSDTAAILGIELFDKAYIEMICSLNKPTVFVDGYAEINCDMMRCDFVAMENVASVISIVNRMIDVGAKKIGFVGDITHCNSFYERWVGFIISLGNHGLSVNHDLCILAKDSNLYGDTDWLLTRLGEMPEMPDAFVCANDYLAIHLMTALKRMGLSIPAEVMVAGFDGSIEADLSEPSLTTARIPSSEIGRLASHLLFQRIQFPDFPFSRVKVKTIPVFGGSTR